MFERFHADARRVVVLAQEEARQLRADSVDAGHLLLALRGAGGTAAEALAGAGIDPDDLLRHVRAADHAPLDGTALASVGIDLDEVRRATEESFGPGALDRPARSWRAGHIRFGPAAKKALEQALRVAVGRGDRSITGGHLLLGLLCAPHGDAVRLLTAAGVDVDALRRDTESRLDRRAA